MNWKDLGWYALHTRSRFEKKVYDSLCGKSLEAFLPRVEVMSRRKDRRKRIMVPIIPGYVFVRTDLDGNVFVEELDHAIYVHGSTERPEGAHAVEIVGWSDPYVDSQGNQQLGYWIIKNSWGEGYGLNGYVLFPMGTNECAIETLVLSGIPDQTAPKIKEHFAQIQKENREITSVLMNDPIHKESIYQSRLRRYFDSI